jgi:hypothetical protein
MLGMRATGPTVRQRRANLPNRPRHENAFPPPSYGGEGGLEVCVSPARTRPSFQIRRSASLPRMRSVSSGAFFQCGTKRGRNPLIPLEGAGKIAARCGTAVLGGSARNRLTTSVLSFPTAAQQPIGNPGQPPALGLDSWSDLLSAGNDKVFTLPRPRSPARSSRPAQASAPLHQRP